MIHTPLEDTASFGHLERCGNCSTARLSRRTKCAICQEEVEDYNDIVPNHRCPKGMRGGRRDDHPDNIQAVHWWCNSKKGSSRPED